MFQFNRLSLGFATALLSTLGAASVACSGDGADATSSSDVTKSNGRPFNLNDQSFGSARKAFSTPSGVTEVCVVAKHQDDADFSDSDCSKEAKLCTIDFNADPADGVLAAGLLPKNNSTNPATEVYAVTADRARSVVESQKEAFADKPSSDKLAVLKSSLDDRFEATTTYAPSILGYYGTSRMLGNIAEVAPAVWRTLDVKRHEQFAKMGSALPLSVSRNVRKLWSLFVQTDESSDKGVLTYTTDGQQVFGALIAKTSDDAKDKTIDTVPLLTGSAQFRHLRNGSPIASMVAGGAGSTLKDAVQTIVPMQGVSEMLILDAIMLQSDRLSEDNVSYIPYMFYKDTDGTIKHQAKKKFSADDAKAHPDAVEVKKLYLNDVDAGLSRSSATMLGGTEVSLLKQLTHISPDLYKRLMKLNALTSDAAFQQLTKDEWRYTDNNFAAYKIMVNAVATMLANSCKSGDLLLDLDVRAHLAGTNLTAKQGCDGQ